MSYVLINNDECIAQWVSINARFNKLIDGFPAPEKIKKDLMKLRDEAAQKNSLTYRQMQSMIAKIDNYLKGQYGNTKTAKHLAAGKQNS